MTNTISQLGARPDADHRQEEIVRLRAADTELGRTVPEESIRKRR
ncbi:MAG: hypothetical protein ACRDRH_03385 [Pseudonocardia sp.]